MSSFNATAFCFSQVNDLTRKKRFIIYSVFVFFLAYILGQTMSDDGLRHIAFAAHSKQMHSWQQVFPYSIFSEADPWFSWHFILSVLISVTGKDQVHLWVNIFFLSSLCFLIDSLVDQYTRRNLSFLLPIFVMLIVSLSAQRYLNVRPDNFSGLYIMLALLSLDNPLLLFFATLSYSLLYYLFFVQVAFIGLVCFFQKKWLICLYLFLSGVIAFLFYWYSLGNDYWDILYNTYVVGKASQEGIYVGELLPLIPSLLLVYNKFGLYLVAFEFLIIFYLIYLFYDDLQAHTLLLFLLLSFPLWFSKVRFFALYLPLICSFLFIGLINLKFSGIKRVYLEVAVLLNKIYWYIKQSQWVMLSLLVVVGLKLILTAYPGFASKQNKKYTFFQNSVFDNKRILTNSLNTYVFQGLYVNPSLQFIPSCEINGFRSQDKRLLELYQQLMLQKLSPSQVAYFAHQVHADYYLYQLNNKKIEFSVFKKNGLIPWKIVNGDSVIFKVT